MATPIISFKDFSFKYTSQQEPTLKHINLDIYAGEKILIAGPSGSGKSTLVHCLNGLVPFSYSGEMTGFLTLQGIDAKNINLFERSTHIGTVLQDPDSQFVGLTVGEDIAFALENDAVEQSRMHQMVEEVAHTVDMSQKLSASIHELSGGQKQRTALGGILVDHVSTLLFDEPLANLDPYTGKMAIEWIDRIHRESKKTVIIVEHRIEDVLHRPVDRIILMNDGKIVADLSSNELLASDLLKQYQLREPLYITALKSAGINIRPELHPSSIDTLSLPEEDKKKVRQWFNAHHDFHSHFKGQTLLELKNINFSYQDNQPFLKSINFTLSEGEMVSIVGKNGAGKSTLSKVITGLERQDSGQILLRGRDISQDSITQRAQAIGFVMQNPNQMISKALIFDEVALGLRLRGLSEEEVKERVEATLKICGLYSFRHWPISALSFGQKKRVTIAAILVLKPDILILDEPTAGQDLHHYTEFMSFLKELNQKGMTILMITHDMHLMMEYTNRAIVLTDGKVLADDSVVTILGNQALTKKAHLLATSLYQLADQVGLSDREKFVACFIHSEEVNPYGA